MTPRRNKLTNIVYVKLLSTIELTDVLRQDLQKDLEELIDTKQLQLYYNAIAELLKNKGFKN